MNLKRAASRLTACLLLASTLITPVLAVTGTVNTGSSSLRLRSKASTKGTVLKNLARNTVVDVLEILDNGWCQVSYNGVTGYVSSEYLTISEEAAPAEPQADEGTPEAQADEAAEDDALYVKVTTSTLNVRSGPGFSGRGR